MHSVFTAARVSAERAASPVHHAPRFVRGIYFSVGRAGGIFHQRPGNIFTSVAHLSSGRRRRSRGIAAPAARVVVSLAGAHSGGNLLEYTEPELPQSGEAGAEAGWNELQPSQPSQDRIERAGAGTDPISLRVERNHVKTGSERTAGQELKFKRRILRSSHSRARQRLWHVKAS